MSSTSQSNLSLFYFYWSPVFSVRIGHIDALPKMRVFECMVAILQADKNPTPFSAINLYTIPQNHPVLLKDLKDTLGPLSISDLGEPLPLNESLENIFGLQPEADRLHLILVNQAALTIHYR
ncbi:hypothetical protein OG21DRAFT_1492147 [Imleria badia]|nr:hypothetical protein OG21DRAFT_1492147 [Imleria badia]